MHLDIKRGFLTVQMVRVQSSFPIGVRDKNGNCY